MTIQHNVRISVAQRDGPVPVIRSGIRRIPSRIIRFLFGDCTEIYVLQRGQTVKSVEIHEMKGDETKDEAV